MPMDHNDEYNEPAYRPSRGEQRAGRGKRRTSVLGVALFVIAIVMGAAEFILHQVDQFSPRRSRMFSNSPEGMLLAGLAIASIAISLVGALLALIALIQPKRDKVFAILGLIFNVMIILGVIGFR